MDNNNENFSGFEEDKEKVNEQSEKSKESDEILSKLNNHSKKLEICITARQRLNELEKKKFEYKNEIKEKERIIQQLKSQCASVPTIDINNDEFTEYKNNVKQNCVTISEYATKMRQEIDTNPNNISELVRAVEKELTAIEIKGKIVIALQEKNNLFQVCTDLQKQCAIAENRFQIALADYNDSRLL